VAYRLLIEADYRIINNEYPGILQRWEMPRGSIIELELYVTNISSSIFNGLVTGITISFNETAFGSSSIVDEKVQIAIDGLPPNLKTKLYQTNVRMFSEGKGWIRCVLESSDKQPIEYFHSVQEPPILGSVWVWGFDVISREQLEIVKLLKEIRDKIR
jgi:hypothetical protein